MFDQTIATVLESIDTLRVTFKKKSVDVRGLYMRPHHKHHVWNEESTLVINSHRISLEELPRALNLKRFNLTKAHRRAVGDKSCMERAIFRWKREIAGEIMRHNRPGFATEDLFRHFCNVNLYDIRVYRDTKLGSFGIYCVDVQ